MHLVIKPDVTTSQFFIPKLASKDNTHFLALCMKLFFPTRIILLKSSHNFWYKEEKKKKERRDRKLNMGSEQLQLAAVIQDQPQGKLPCNSTNTSHISTSPQTKSFLFVTFMSTYKAANLQNAAGNLSKNLSTHHMATTCRER